MWNIKLENFIIASDPCDNKGNFFHFGNRSALSISFVIQLLIILTSDWSS